MVGTTEAAFLLQISPQRVRQLLAEGRIIGAVKRGRFWQIPLWNGMPKVTRRKRGPKGRWSKRPQRVATYIHVNQSKIRSNMHKKDKEPVIAVKKGKKSILCHLVEIPGLGRLVYQPDCPKKCGARVWLELEPHVRFTTHQFA